MSSTASTMPQSNGVGPDTPVALKINYEGGVRRARLLLRDVGANHLENKLRDILSIPAESKILLERFSDSAGNFLVLDRQNVPVYKQLYRAAKAKQKLKLRVTVKAPTVQHTPRSVTVEDAPEVETPVTVESAIVTPTPEPTPAPIVAPIPIPTALAHRTRAMQSTESSKPIPASVRAKTAQTDINNIPITYTSSTATSTATSSVRFANATPRKVAIKNNFAVCCNNCDRRIPDMHHHCSICDGGDFDLCQECVDKGVSCNGANHWLIKRFVDQDKLVTSTTEKKTVPKAKAAAMAAPTLPAKPLSLNISPGVSAALGGHRTCNSCVHTKPDLHFVHCNNCEDFDLCMICFAKNRHGHDPKHGFKAVVESSSFSRDFIKMLAPGRNAKHHAICDGCDKYIYGIRHKCADCPDWDYCSDCVASAGFIHPGHRFVPLYEQETKACVTKTRAQVHYGIICDGPLCGTKTTPGSHIVGDRYKCAVCHDTDFCANCEASPSNKHNKTHPLIKFKTPVRHVTVSTQGEHENGGKMPAMGDLEVPSHPAVLSPYNSQTTLVQPVVAVAESVKSVEKETVKVETPEPVEQVAIKVEEPKPVQKTVQKTSSPGKKTEKSADTELMAVFVRDAIVDGTKLQTDQIFQQTWVMRNDGTTTWPAGCAVRFVGGDYMGYADSRRPAGVRDLVSAGESSRCYYPIAPGQQFAFTVLLRAPTRSGPAISYWRLTTDDNILFGHRLWCDINVQPRKVVEVKKEEIKQVEEPAIIFKDAPKEVKVETAPVVEPSSATIESIGSQMIFPKLDKESPVSSIHQEIQAAAPAPEVKSKAESEEQDDDFDDVAGEEAEWEESQDDFMTDEEYDILDASDDEYLEEQEKIVRKK